MKLGGRLYIPKWQKEEIELLKSIYPNQAWETILNGVSLCKKCHISFHQMFGYGGNTEKQFNQWLVQMDKLKL